MYKFNSGRRIQPWVVLLVIVLVALPAFYIANKWAGWGTKLAIFLIMGLFLMPLTFTLMRNYREENLRYYALHDPLTNLQNRSSFMESVTRALDHAVRESGSICVLIVDLDDFEGINHSLGYEAGDELLTVVGERLEASIRPGGAVARLCGDEFAVLLEDGSDKNSAISVAKRIGENLRSPIRLEGNEVLVSASVGVAIGASNEDSHEDSPEDLLRNADVAMHAAKRKGKARYKVFDPGADTTTSRRVLLEAEMRRAIKEEEFRVYYQPLVALETGKIRGLEALVRWQHPTYGLVPPGEFIPLAEQTGLIAPIGRWVLREACRQVRLWQRERLRDSPLMLSVNVSACQFRQPNLVKEILMALEESGLDPHHLKLEITESVMMYDASAIAALRELKDLGVELAMDDFGTGYSNLSYLKRLSIDTLKIDRSYISGLVRDTEDTAIVHATIAFAKALGLNLIAEGIENAKQLAQLRELGCEMGQGYYFSKPLPINEMSKILVTGLRQ